MANHVAARLHGFPHSALELATCFCRQAPQYCDGVLTDHSKDSLNYRNTHMDLSAWMATGMKLPSVTAEVTLSGA